MGDRVIGTVSPQTNTRPARSRIEIATPETVRDIGVFSVAEQSTRIGATAVQGDHHRARRVLKLGA
jgi:hypothetical protein